MTPEGEAKYREACDLVHEQLWNGMDVPHLSDVDGLCDGEKVWLLGWFTDEQLCRVVAARTMLMGLRKNFEAIGE